MNQDSNKETSQVDEPPEPKRSVAPKDKAHYKLLSRGIRSIVRNYLSNSFENVSYVAGAMQAVLESHKRNGELKFFEELTYEQRRSYRGSESLLLGCFVRSLSEDYSNLTPGRKANLHEDFSRFFAFYQMGANPKRESVLNKERSKLIGLLKNHC